MPHAVHYECQATIVEASVEVPSSSKTGSVYEVVVTGRDAAVTCSCRGFRHRGKCRHVKVESRDCGWRSDTATIPMNVDSECCPVCGGVLFRAGNWSDKMSRGRTNE